MSALAFTDLYNSVIDLSSSQISAADAKKDVNDAYFDILRLRPWFGLLTTEIFNSAVDKSAGTVSLTQGSAAVIGVGTAFATSDQGRYLRANQRVGMRIQTVTDATHLTLQQNWGEVTVSAASYAIFSLRYPLPSNAERVTRISGPFWRLVRMNASMVDAYDPSRIYMGQPLIWYEIELISGVTEIEVWPVPNQVDTYMRQYRIAPTKLVADGDVPVIAGEAIRAKARSERCKKLLSRTGDQNWALLMNQYDNDYEKILNRMIWEDRRMRASSPVVLDIDDSGPSGAWLRTWSALGLQSIAGTPSGYGMGGFGGGGFGG